MSTNRILAFATTLALSVAPMMAYAQDAENQIDCEDEANEDDPACAAVIGAGAAGTLGLPAGAAVTNFVPLGLGALGAAAGAAALAGGGGSTTGTTSTTSTTGTN